MMTGNKSGRILLADDDEDVLWALEHRLENGGHSTVSVLNYEDASSILSRTTFDLLVLDDYLSDKDSIQSLTEFRRSGTTMLVIVTYYRFPSFHRRKATSRAWRERVGEQERALRIGRDDRSPPQTSNRPSWR